MAASVMSVQYRAGLSRLNIIHPIVKLFLLVCITLALLTFPGIIFQTAALGMVILLYLDASINPLQLQGGRITLITAVFIAVLQIIFVRDGRVIISIGEFSMTLEGLERAAAYGMRFLSLILYGFLFVLTTEPNQFVQAAMRAGLPYRYGYTLISAIRMMPIFKEEVRKISWAQKGRGMNYSLFPVKRLLKRMGSFITVLMVSLVKKVNALVLSFEGRSFGLHEKRTFIRNVRFGMCDALLTCIGILSVIYTFLRIFT